MRSNENKIESRLSSYENYIQANEFIWKEYLVYLWYWVNLVKNENDTESRWSSDKNEPVSRSRSNENKIESSLSSYENETESSLSSNEKWSRSLIKESRSSSYKSYTESSQMNQMTLTQVNVNENDMSQDWVHTQMRVKFEFKWK